MTSVSSTRTRTAERLRRVSQGWGGSIAPRVRLLPRMFEFSEIPAEARERGIVLGLQEQRLQPVVLDPRTDGLVLIGDADCEDVDAAGDGSSGRRAVAAEAGQPVVVDRPGCLHHCRRLCAGGQWRQPLLPLLEFLPRARDVGLHLCVARRAGGAGRAPGDPVLSSARELGFPGLVMSALRDEGVLLGVRAAPLPPGRGTLLHRKLGTVPVKLARLGSPDA